MAHQWRYHADKVNCYTITTPEGKSIHFDPDPSVGSARELGEMLERLVSEANDGVETCEVCDSREIKHHDVELVPFCEDHWHDWVDEPRCEPVEA